MTNNETSRHNNVTSAWMVMPYTQHINTQVSTNNFTYVLYL